MLLCIFIYTEVASENGKDTKLEKAIYSVISNIFTLAFPLLLLATIFKFRKSFIRMEPYGLVKVWKRNTVLAHRFNP